MNLKIQKQGLLKNELKLLKINEFVAQGKQIGETFEYESKFSETSLVIKIPSDAILTEGGRKDHDSKVGGLVEFYFPRRRKLNLLNFKGDKFLHLDTEVSTTVPLETRTSESVANKEGAL